ncbi:hypothetical protein BJX65DRAFT_313910 [Aspergillus insuetus]
MPPFEQRAVGDSLVYQGRKFRFPFAPGGDTVPLPMQEVGRVHPLMREKILRIAAGFARKAEPWDQNFLNALEREGVVSPGTAVGYFVKLRELERGDVSTVKVEVQGKVGTGSKGGASLDRVTQWLETLVARPKNNHKHVFLYQQNHSISPHSRSGPLHNLHRLNPSNPQSPYNNLDTHPRTTHKRRLHLCDIVLLDGNKYAPLTIRRGETLHVPFVIKDKIVHLNRVCTAPATKAQTVINQAHFAIHGSQVWTLSSLTVLEEEGIAPPGTVGYYENLTAVEEEMGDSEISMGA